MEAKDDQQELKAMAEFYSGEYAELYFVRDLKADVIVAVEGYPAINNRPMVMRNGRRFNCMNYKERLLSSRERLDFTPDGKPMVGYETIFGNDTRLGKAEKGVVEETSATPETVATAQFGVSSPFELAQKKKAVEEAMKETLPDYELTEVGGKTIERFETFQLERIK